MLDATCTCPDSLDYDGGVACEYQKEQTMDDIEITIAEPGPITLGEYAQRKGPQFFKFDCEIHVGDSIYLVARDGENPLAYLRVAGPDAGLLKYGLCARKNEVVIPCDIDGNPLDGDGGWKPLSEFKVGDIVQVKDNNIGVFRVGRSTRNYDTAGIFVHNPLSERDGRDTLWRDALARRVRLKVEVVPV
jgi:hypothetical protein